MKRLEARQLRDEFAVDWTQLAPCPRALCADSFGLGTVLALSSGKGVKRKGGQKTNA